MRKRLSRLKRLVKAILSDSWYIWKYRGAARQLGNHLNERNQRFADMVRRSANQPAMQIGVRDAKCAPHWVSVDLYDPSPLIDYHYDIHDLQLEDHTFDFVACVAVLEHVPYPQQAIAELYRVLRPGGEIWVEIPFNQPYHLAPADYWRVTPDGMRIWLKDFQEIACDVFAIDRSAIYNGVYYHGKKPHADQNEV